MPCFENFDLSVFPDEVPEGYRLTQKKLMENLLYQAQNYSDGFPDNEKPNILLLGKTGVGKTYLAMCIVRAVMDKGYAVLSTNAFGLFERLAQRLSGQDIDLNHIRQADLLFIDDLGMEPVLNNFTIEYLFEILNARLLNRKNTIITSNLTAKELQERYTDRITSRLFDQANSLVIYMPGKDLRLSKRQTKQ
ncbi:MAG TPA: ATP-binding protein [Clostridia bacterium]|nr:ATP-binding protein [Clostridia bacterium]